MRIQFVLSPNSEALSIEIIYQRFANDFEAFDIVVCQQRVWRRWDRDVDKLVINNAAES